MKKLICIVIFLLAPAIVAAECPCNDPPVYVCCGSLTCDIWSNAATYVMGGSCAPKPRYYCCVNGGPFRKAAESTEEPLTQFDVQFLHGNKPIDALTPNGVPVRMTVNGKTVPGIMGHGKIVDGYLEMQSGDRYLMLAGDLFLVRQEDD